MKGLSKKGRLSKMIEGCQGQLSFIRGKQRELQRGKQRASLCDMLILWTYSNLEDWELGWLWIQENRRTTEPYDLNETKQEALRKTKMTRISEFEFEYVYKGRFRRSKYPFLSPHIIFPTIN